MNVQNGMGAGVNGNNVKKLNIWYGTTSLGEAFKEKAPFLLGIAQITLPPCTQFGQLFHFWTSVKINLARGSPPPIQTMPGRKGFFSGRASIIYSSSVLCMGDKGLKVFKKVKSVECFGWEVGEGKVAGGERWGFSGDEQPRPPPPLSHLWGRITGDKSDTHHIWCLWPGTEICDRIDQVNHYGMGLWK